MSDLAKRLRDRIDPTKVQFASAIDLNFPGITPLMGEAADLIDQQAREIERLKALMRCGNWSKDDMGL